jgi:hypothetical protein
MTEEESKKKKKTDAKGKWKATEDDDEQRYALHTSIRIFRPFCAYCIRYSAIPTSQFTDCAFTLHQLSSALLALSTQSLVILAITTLRPPHILTYNPALHRLYDASASAHLSGYSTS